jgi:hypothetical protein
VQYGVIQNSGNAMGEVRDLGEDEKRNYYLFPQGFMVQLDTYQIFVSETERGDKILLSRFDLAK